MQNPTASTLRGAALAVTAMFLFSCYGRAQQAAPAPLTTPSEQAMRELQDQVRQLATMVQEMRAENQQSRAEMQQLRQDLQATRALLAQPAGAQSSELTAHLPAENGTSKPSEAAGNRASLEERVQKLEDSSSLINSKIDEQYQTKVETASKYRARLHGIVLMNAFRNIGGSDNLDFPDYS
ncbi:MAG TPA: hypothetical protein VMU05_11325, partial [Dongiaceae bacterium]|nr:hypothetical protein [Dongiaceae bacterium]